MRKSILCLFFLFSISFFGSMGGKEGNIEPERSAFSEDESQQLFEQMKLDGLIRLDAFKAAYTGYNKLNKANSPLLTLIDFSLPSTEKRMYVLDLAKKKILFISYVSHGRNSGENYATSFSNRDGSHQTSLGFYRTVNTYNGGNGYSLRLEGLEKGVNDKAMQRAIVIHGADYCSEKVIRSTGRLGRSFGCPALPRELTKPIIDTIKGGSLLFIYANQAEYFVNSEILRKAMTTFGYSNVVRHLGYDDSEVIDMQRNDNPVFIAAISGLVGGHAWIIDGYIQQKRTIDFYNFKGNLLSSDFETRDLMHCNFGWKKGACNGYYISGIFKTKNGVIEVDGKTYDTGYYTEGSSNYNWAFHIITYNNPN